MQSKLATLLLTSTLICCGCNKQPPGSDFVPGTAMVFPLRSAGVLEDLGNRFMEGCKSPDAAVEQTCMARLTKLKESCRGFEPPVFATKAEYKNAAEQFAHCLVPKEICQGVEIETDEQRAALCKN